MIEISIVIPAYNEEKRIATVLSNYSSYFQNHERQVVSGVKAANGDKIDFADADKSTPRNNPKRMLDALSDVDGGTKNAYQIQ